MPNHWTRPELLAALNLYHQTPFGKQHSTHPPILRLAERIGRSPGAVAMKLSNFTSLDPEEQARGISGLSGASNADRAIWEEFAGHFEMLADESEAALESFDIWNDETRAPDPPEEIENSTAVVKVRRRQQFFRKIVLSSYQNRCAISQLAIKELLVASHIKPWSIDPQNRLNPRNGLSLAATYDKAFDRGFIGFNESLELNLAPRIKALAADSGQYVEVESVFERFEGNPLVLPEKNLPDPEFLAWHFKNVFRN
ncbi:MAG: HNH endonuclease [Verrucomicrobiales bacterium]|nr:HNH endonuclease [Verrucomicrobiales bacterium]